MSALLLRGGLFSMVWLLISACGESTTGQHGGHRRDPGAAAPFSAAEEQLAVRIQDLETRLVALERRVTQLVRRKGFPEDDLLPRGGRGPSVAETGRPSPKATHVSESAEQAAGLGQAVDFTNAQEGQIFPQYGARNMIVKTSAGLGLTSASSDPVDLVFSDFSLAEQIEVVVSLRTGFWMKQQIRLLNDSRPVITVTLRNYDLKFGDHVKKRSTTGWKRGEERNQLRIVIENNNAWLYINKRFFGVQEIESSKANRLEITGIKRDQDFVYSVSVRPPS